MADDEQKPPEDTGRVPASPRDEQAAASGPASAGSNVPEAAADKPASAAPASAAPAATAGKPAMGADVTTKAPPVPGKAAVGAEAAVIKAPPAAKAAHPPAAPAPPSGPTDPPPPPDVTVPVFIETLRTAVPGSVAHVSYYLGDFTIVVPVAHLLETARHLRDAPAAAFDFCSDVTATDWPPRTDTRFDVVYCLYSTRLRHRVRLKVKIGELQPVPSVSGVWPAANWLEREVYDMFGVNFTGHPDRRRILMPDDWQGFPQRKDYPLEGPGELLMENPLDWLKLRQARNEADIE